MAGLATAAQLAKEGMKVQPEQGTGICWFNFAQIFFLVEVIGSLMIFGGLDHFPQLQVISHQLRKKLFVSLFIGFLEIPAGVNPRWVGFFPLHKAVSSIQLKNDDCEDSWYFFGT